MKNRRMISLLCAIAMSLTLVLPVSAANVSDNAQLSEFAGKTISCQVIQDTANGATSRMIQVAIPANTTVDEEIALVNSAALGEAMTRSLRSVPYELSSRSNITIQSTSTSVGGGVLDNKNYSYIVSQFVVDTIGGSSKLYVQVKNRTNISSTDWYPVTLTTYPQRIVYTSNDVNLKANSEIQVYARTSSGTAFASVCYVAATDYAPY